MQIFTNRPTVGAFASALLMAHPGSPQPIAAEIIGKAVADGWLAILEIENLFLATDPRLWKLTTRELLALFKVRAQPVLERPRRGHFDAEGIERVSASDLARLLILAERAGLAVDPLPLCTALLPTLGARRLLTEAELLTYWRAQGHISPDPFVIRANPAEDSFEAMTHDKPTIHTTAAGYAVEVWRDAQADDPDAPAVALRITPPARADRAAA